MVRRIVLVVLVASLVLVSCGGPQALDDEMIADLRAADKEYLSDFTDEELRLVATALCDGYWTIGNEPGNYRADYLFFEAAWDQARVKKAGEGVRRASRAIIYAACPEVLASELAPDSAPVKIQFTLLGSEGDDYEYSSWAGCEGLGGYDDLHEGMLFNLSNEQGEIIGVARLDESKKSTSGCTMSGTFSVTYGELDDTTFYLVGDRDGDRGEVGYTGQELREQGEITLSVG